MAVGQRIPFDTLAMFCRIWSRSWTPGLLAANLIRENWSQAVHENLFAPSSVRSLLVVRPGAPSSDLAPSSDARSP